MSSNYPPGVSGNEPQIAGPDREWCEERECKAEPLETFSVSTYGIGQIEQVVAELRDAQPAEPVNHLALIGRLHAALGDIEKVDVDAPCPFAGPVTLTHYQGETTWTCPLCRHEHAVLDEEVEG